MVDHKAWLLSYNQGRLLESSESHSMEEEIKKLSPKSAWEFAQLIWSTQQQIYHTAQLMKQADFISLAIDLELTSVDLHRIQKRLEQINRDNK